MRFLPKIQKIELEQSDPNKIVTAYPGTIFYRVGNDEYYIIYNNSRKRIDIPKRSFTIEYQNQLWFAKAEPPIIFLRQYEMWIKDAGTGYNNVGWI